MTYIPQTWADGNPAYPVSAARIAYIEAGLAAVANGGSIPLNPYVAPYSCPIDGTSDCTVALNAAIVAAAAAGIPVQLQPIVHKLNSGPLVQVSGSYILMQPGTVLDTSARASSSVTSYGITAQGTTGSPLYLTADAGAGLSTITMASGDAATLAVDQWIVVGSNEIYPYLGSTQVAKGEIRQIRSISSGTVTLDEALEDTYHVGSGHSDTNGGAFVRSITFVTNIGVDFNGGQMIGSGTSNDYECGIFYQYVNDFELTRPNVQRMDDELIIISSCINWDIDRPYVRSLYYDGGGTGLGNEYGILISDSSQWGTITNPKGSRVRHLVSVSSESSGQGVWGCPRFIDTINGKAWDCMGGTAHLGQGDAYQHHGFGKHIRFINCDADGCDTLVNLQGGPVEFTGEGRNCYFAGLYINADPRALSGMRIRIRVSQAGLDGGSQYASYVPALIEANLTNASAPYTVGQFDLDLDAEYDATAGAAIKLAQSGGGGSHILAYNFKITGNLRNTGASTGDNYAILADYWDGINVSGVKLYDCYRLIQGYGNDVVVEGNDQWASAQSGSGYVIRADGATWKIKNNHGRAASGILLSGSSTSCFAARNEMDCTTPLTDSGSGNTSLQNGIAKIAAADIGFSLVDRNSVRVTAMGWLTEPFSMLPNTDIASTAPTAGTIYGALIGLGVGDIVTNIGFAVLTAGAGTAPTLVRFGLADATGKIVAVTADIHASSVLTSTGPQAVALTSPYTVTTQGGYYVVMIQVGSWGTTQMKLASGISSAAGAISPYGSNSRPACTGGAAQSDLPAVNSSVTLSSSSVVAFWLPVS